MNYEKTLEFIHSLNRFGIKPGLERITALANHLGNPHKNLKFIHVAGTNGKGSTSTMLSNIMYASGKKTGLFISPFVVDFRERIQVNGQYIAKEDLCRLVEMVKSAADKTFEEQGDAVTEFEFITMVAFLYFAETKCDIVVLETGLGGRLDSTNIIQTPLASVITKIALDHTAVLGETIEKIAAEKCGIIKQNSLVVTPSTQNSFALSVIENAANVKGSPLALANRESVDKVKLTPFGTELIYKGIPLTTTLAGTHQIENLTLAAETALQLGVEKEYIIKGISDTFFPARLEVISKNPLVVLDGAHNDNGADALCEYLDNHNLRPVVLMGMMADKDCESVARKIASRARAVVTVSVASNQRTSSSKALKNLAAKYCAETYSAKTYNEALCLASERAKELEASLIVCGSLYLASDIRPALLKMYNK